MILEKHDLDKFAPVHSLLPPSIANLRGRRVIIFSGLYKEEKYNPILIGWPAITSDIILDDVMKLWKGPLVKESADEVYEIKGSTGKIYKVELGKIPKCTCTGYKFRRKCKHIDQAKKLQSLKNK